MNKLLAKLLTCILALVVSASLVVMSSYAWLTMSGAPEVDGIQVNIGGSNTILVAADMTVLNSDGTVSHYPGAFTENLNFSDHTSYDYLDQVSGLLPVSTTDGVNWILPDYYDYQDDQVRTGQAINGQLKEFSDFTVDDTLSSGNLTQLTEESRGHYIYLDFWVVSPGADYELRISTGDASGNSGSYVVEIPNPQKQEDTFVLASSQEMSGSSVRLGFLVNSDTAADDDLRNYIRSDDYSNRYRRLQGKYTQPGQTLQDIQAKNNRFTIYEPNGNLHGAPEDGNYYITKPLTYAGGTIYPADIADRLTVQLQSTWRQATGSEQTLLQQEFATAIAGKSLANQTESSLWRYFYQERLQWQLAPYIQRGRFVTNTQALYDAVRYGKVAPESEALRVTSNATQDVYITTLEEDVPQRIRMFIWLEGQDSDCGNYSDASSFSVNLELAGSNDY